MKPHIYVITLAVADLGRALAFYRDGLGFQTEGLIGTEFTGNQTIPDGTTAVFHLDGGLMLSIYPRSELAKDAVVPLIAAKPGEFSIGHVVASRAEVDEVIVQAKAAGAAVTDRQGVTMECSSIPLRILAFLARQGLAPGPQRKHSGRPGHDRSALRCGTAASVSARPSLRLRPLASATGYAGVRSRLLAGLATGRELGLIGSRGC